MKKILFAIMAAACLIGCDEPYEIPQEVFYVTDSVECEVRGRFEIVFDLVNNRQEVPNKRYVPPAPREYAAIVTPEVTYLYQWQLYRWDNRSEDDIMAQVPLGDTVRVRGTVRTLTSDKGRSFQDIIVDSILEITPTIIERQYVDTVENAVIQGMYIPNMFLTLSEYADYEYPCIYLPMPNQGYEYHPSKEYYINPDVNFKVAEDNKSAYLCGVLVGREQWVEVTCDLITGLTTYDAYYWWVNMKSVKIISAPEQYKD